MNETANFLAVDLGASSGRVLLGRWDGSRFELQELHRFDNDPVRVLDHFHWNVLRLWAEMKTGFARYAAQFQAAPAGIGIDTWGVDFVLLDRAGNLLGNPYTYRDPRTEGVPEQVYQRVPRQIIFEHTGIQFMRINTLYQLWSMTQTNHPQLQAADTMLLIPDLFHYWLTGRKAVEYTNATTTQMFHSRERRWAADLLSQLDIPTRILPEIVTPGSVLGELRSDVAAELGLRSPVPVIAPGTHDTASAVAAIPGLDERSAYISSGTWSLMGVEIPEPIINDRSLALNFTNEGGVAGTIRLLKNIGGLWLVQECRRRWQREGHSYSWEELLSLAEQAEPFRSIVDPDDASLISPDDMPAAIRAFCRNSGQPEPESAGAIVRCCLESLALRYRWVLDALEDLTGRHLETIRIVGGGSQNRMLCQFTADACGRPVVAGPVEATALGNVLMQAIAGGYLPDLQAGRQAIAASVALETFEPSSGAAWQEAFARFNSLGRR